MIGFDLGTRGFKVVELRRRFGRYFVTGQNQIDLEAEAINQHGLAKPDQFARALSQTFNQAKPRAIKQKTIVAALPESFLYTKNITLPTKNPKEAIKTLRYTLQFEATELFPAAPDDLYIDYLVGGYDQHSTSVLIVAAPKAIVNDFVKTVEATGYQLLAIETKALALARLFIDPQTKLPLVLCDIGASVTKLSIFNNSQLIFTLTTAIGATQLRRKPTAFKQLAQEINKIVDFYRGKAKNPHWQPGQIIISGGGAHVPRVDSKLAKATGFNCGIGQSRFKIDPYDPQFAVAYGLALSRYIRQ